MSGTSSGDGSELEPEVPTEVPSDVEVVAASGDGVPGPPGPTVTSPSPAMASAPAVEFFPDTPTAEPEALARKQRLVLDKAYRYLLDQGFGVLELASLDLDEVPAMARQLAEELAIPSGDWLADALYCWLQEAQQEAKIHRRVRGYLQDDLTWMTLMPPMVLPTKEGAGRGLRYAPEAPPPKGERNRKLVDDGCIVAAREERLLDIWCRKLQAELLEMEAPIISTLKGSLDPDRAALLLVGKTRASTLKRYLSYYRQWRLWLAEAKLRYPPGRPADLVDYLLARRDEPCGRSVPEAILKAISWMERVAEYPEEQRATHGRLAWAAKDKITEILSDGARLIKRAPRYPVHLLAQFEKLVLDPGHAIGWRVWAWAKLLKVWGSLRWSDLQAIIPAELALVEGRLVTTLRRTKTSGPNRRVRELPVAISEHAFFVKSSWLREGFNLLKEHANYKRDYLMPRLKSDGGLEPKPACYADAMVATAGLLGILGLPLELQGYWTEHSERSVLPTALSLMDVPPQDKDLLGRWKPEGSDVYARSFGGRVARLQALFAGAAREADRYTRLDEREIAADLVPWLMERPKLSRDQAELTVEGLRRRWRGGGPWSPDPVPATPTSEEPPLGVPTQAGDLEGSSQASASEPGEPVCKQARVLDRQANYVIVELPGAIFRLHKAGASGCWMGRRRAFRNSRDFVARPKAHEYTHVCRLCWPNRYQGSDDDPSEGSLANSGDEQAPLEAVPASSQIPQLGVMLPANFANFGFSAPP